MGTEVQQPDQQARYTEVDGAAIGDNPVVALQGEKRGIKLSESRSHFCCKPFVFLAWF